MTNMTNMTNMVNVVNVTNMNRDNDDGTYYYNTGFIFICLMLFFSFCSISCTFYNMCIKDANIEKFINKYFPCLKKEDEEYQVRYNSESDSDSDYGYSQEDNYIKPDEIPIKKIPTFSNINLYPMHCSICQEEKLNTVKIDCGHHFCKECITGYMEVGRECPNCRKGIKHIYEIEVLVFN